MTDTRIGVALFGVGRAGTIHFHSLVRSPRVHLLYIVEKDQSDRAKSLVADYHLDATVLLDSEADKVYNDSRVGAVVVCSPTFAHEDIVRGALSHDDDSDLRATAVREFHEELGFGQENVDIDVSSLQEIHSECSGKYKYFAVEVGSHQLRNLDLERINQGIAAFERGSDLQKIFDRARGKQQSGARFPEMHVIKCVDLEELEREMEYHEQGSTYISGQCKKFCTFLSEVLKVKAQPRITDHIIDHLKKEPVDWNVTAAKKLIRHLSE